MLRRASAKLTRRPPPRRRNGVGRKTLSRAVCSRARSRLPSPVAGRRYEHLGARATTGAGNTVAGRPDVPSQPSTRPLYARPLGASSSSSDPCRASGQPARSYCGLDRTLGILSMRTAALPALRSARRAGRHHGVASGTGRDRPDHPCWLPARHPSGCRPRPCRDQTRARQPVLHREHLGERSWRVARSRRCPRRCTRWS
jgi:hypothetical protein